MVPRRVPYLSLRWCSPRTSPVDRPALSKMDTASRESAEVFWRVETVDNWNRN